MSPDVGTGHNTVLYQKIITGDWVGSTSKQNFHAAG